jgi:SAM-dependent MidA family methyltransferase
VEQIRREILEQGPLTFARFMELALHHPRFGYYAAGSERLGERGDFITAGDLGPAFGRAMARQIEELDRECGRPAPFDVIEFGAGRGLLARDMTAVLDQRFRYVAVDASEGMRRSIAEIAPAAVVSAAADEWPAGRGCVLAMELFDALPVHRVRRRAGRLEEIGVGWERERFVETTLEPGADVAAWAERYGAAAEDGFEAEVCTQLDRQFARFDRAIDKGFALVLDYGDTAGLLYGRDRKRGTLLAYSAQRTNEDYLARVGLQDLTAHVNFTALADTAAARGWRTVGHTTQDRFLIANGVLEQFDEIDDEAYHDPAGIEARWRIKQLIQPGGMGRRFQVWIFCKGFAENPVLLGLADPFAR